MEEDNSSETGTRIITNTYRKYTIVPNLLTFNTCATKFPVINAAYSNSTWSKHNSALMCLKKFEILSKEKFEWPLTTSVINNFCNWATTILGLKSDTVKSYVTSLAFIHRLNLLDDTNCNNFIAGLILKGAANMELYRITKSRKRNIMTLPLLKILGHKIAVSNWTINSKQLIWTISTVAFFGSFRIGELLTNNEKSFDPFTDLLWNDVEVKDNRLLIHIKAPKSKNKGGDYVDIFEFKNHKCCPVKAFQLWEKTSKIKGKESPIFRFANGKLLTKAVFNATIRSLLRDEIGQYDGIISGHSFRAGIPSMLAKYPEIAKDTHILGWGRWSSDCYQSYTRLRLEQKMSIFRKITDILNK